MSESIDEDEMDTMDERSRSRSTSPEPVKIDLFKKKMPDDRPKYSNERQRNWSDERPRYCIPKKRSHSPERQHDSPLNKYNDQSDTENTFKSKKQKYSSYEKGKDEVHIKHTSPLNRTTYKQNNFSYKYNQNKYRGSNGNIRQQPYHARYGQKYDRPGFNQHRYAYKNYAYNRFAKYEDQSKREYEKKRKPHEPAFDHTLMDGPCKVHSIIFKSPVECLKPEKFTDSLFQSIVCHAKEKNIRISRKAISLDLLDKLFPMMNTFFTNSINKETWIDIRRETIICGELPTLIAMLEELICWIQLKIKHNYNFKDPQEDCIMSSANNLCRAILTKMKEIAPCYLHKSKSDCNFIKQLFYFMCATTKPYLAVDTIFERTVTTPMCLVAAYSVAAASYINSRMTSKDNQAAFLEEYIQKYVPGSLTPMLINTVSEHRKDCDGSNCRRNTYAVMCEKVGSLGLFFFPVPQQSDM